MPSSSIKNKNPTRTTVRRMHSGRYAEAHESVEGVESFRLASSEAYRVGANGQGWGKGKGKGRRTLSVADADLDPVMLRVRREERAGDNAARLVALGFTTISVVYTTYLIASSNPRSLSWFAYHPPLQMASIGLFTLGILTLQPTSQPRTKAAGLVRHQLCMLLAGAPLLVAGTWVIYHNKEINARKHFTTWHGTIGIIAVSWLAIQTVIGCASVWFGGAAFGGGMKAKSVWKYHRLSGYILYPFLIYAAHLGGAWSTFSNSHASHIMRLIAYSIGPIITVIAVYSRIRLSKIKFF